MDNIEDGRAPNAVFGGGYLAMRQADPRIAELEAALEGLLHAYERACIDGVVTLNSETMEAEEMANDALQNRAVLNRKDKPDKRAVERVKQALSDCMNSHGMNDDTYIAPEDQDAMARATIAALVPQEEEVGRMVEAVRTEARGWAMTKPNRAHKLHAAADLLERLVGIQGK